MRKTSPPFGVSASDALAPLEASRLPILLDSWLLACDIERHSARTIEARRDRVGRLVWYATRREWLTVGVNELRDFFRYLNHGHKEPGGRWGNPHQTKPLSAGSVKSYHASLRTFFNWLVEEGETQASPMNRIPVPVDRPDQIQPFTKEQALALLAAAKKTENPQRDEAMVSLMLDTGIRCSELCVLRVEDVSLEQCEVAIRGGKGGKTRYIPFDRTTRKAIYQYLASTDRRGCDRSEPLFVSDRGPTASQHLSRRGVALFVGRLGRLAKIQGVRCSPHTFRHTFAITFLRAGGNVFTLKTMLGHESLAMTNRYVAIAQADIKAQHRMFSPMAQLKAKS